MRRFRVVYDLADPIGFGTLSFEARDIAEALRFMHRHYCRKPVELWCDGRFCARLQRIVERNVAYWRVLDFAAGWNWPVNELFRRGETRPAEAPTTHPAVSEAAQPAAVEADQAGAGARRVNVGSSGPGSPGGGP